MITSFTNFDEFAVAAQNIGVRADLKALLGLDMIFLESYRRYVVLNVKDYGEQPDNLLVLSRDENLAFSAKPPTKTDYKMFKYTLAKKFGESTVLALLVLRRVLRNYEARFKEVDSQIDSFGPNSSLDELEEITVFLRKFTDRVEDFVNLLIQLEDRKIKEVNPNYVSYDYDVLLARARYLLDRCRNHLQELRDIRSEIDVKTTRQLHATMQKLTVIMVFLTVVTVAISVPNTVATILGIPTLADLVQTDVVLNTLLVSILLAAVWGVYYWKTQKW